jgi:putative transposase
MKKTSFTEEQIIAILKRADAGEKIGELCRQAGISDSTFHRWKAKYGGLELSELKRLKQLVDENRRLKQIVADLTLDNAALKDVLAKKGNARCTTDCRCCSPKAARFLTAAGVSSAPARPLDRAINRAVSRLQMCASGCEPWQWLDRALGTDD